MKTHHSNSISILRFFRRAVLLLLCVLLLPLGSGCQRQADEKTVLSSVRYVSDAEKESWRAALIDRLDALHPGGEYVLTDPDAAYPEDRYTYVPGGYSVALLDVTLDGVPELIENMGGGSAGNAFYYAYDLFTGETLMDFDGGHSDAWCTYYNTETGRFELYGRYSWRGGWESRSQYVTTIVYDAKEDCYMEKSFLSEHYQISLKDLGEENESCVEEIWEEYSNTTFYVCGEKVSLDDYYLAQEQFINTCARLPHTGMKLFYWWDILPDEEDHHVRAEAMADALLSSGQCFIKP